MILLARKKAFSMPLFLTLTLFTVLLYMTVLHAQGPGDPGYYPPYVKYHMNISFRGQVFNVDEVSISNDYPRYISGIKITVWVRYDEYDELTGWPVQKEWSEVLYTSVTGRYYKSLDLYKVLPNTIEMGAEYTPFAPWILADSRVLSEYRSIDFEKNFDFIPLMDGDGNGIRDNFELQLAKKFAPTMIPNVQNREMYPEPVNISASRENPRRIEFESNSDIYVTVTDNDDRKGGPWRLDIVDKFNFSSQKWEPLRPEGFLNHERYNYSNLFQNNPVEYVYLRIRLRVSPSLADTLYQLNYDFYNKKLWYHFNFPGYQEYPWLVAYNEWGPQYEHTIYSVVWDYYEPSIQYWFFYPYDNFVNDHEGDWEHINVVLESQIPEKANIKYIDYYFHNQWLKVEEKDAWYDDPERNHPLIFIGGSGIGADIDASRRGDNSGGSYPWPGEYHNIGTAYQNDRVNGQGIPIVEFSYFTQDSTIDAPNDSKYLELLKEPDYWRNIGFFESHKEYSWLGSNLYYGEPKNQLVKYITVLNIPPLFIFFGNPSKSSGIWAPSGPAKHIGWKISGAGQGFKRWDGDFFLDWRHYFNNFHF